MALAVLNNGKNYLVYVNTAVPIDAVTPPAADLTTWKMAMCLNTNALAITVNGIDTTSKCTGGWADSLPGVGSWSITAEGQTVAIDVANAATQLSAEELFVLTTQKTSFWAAIFDPTFATYRAGVVFISSFNETFGNDTAYTFNITLTGRGEIYNEPKHTTT